jgi:hypothetical protein
MRAQESVVSLGNQIVSMHIVSTGIRLAEIRKTRVGAGMPRRDANEMKIHLPDVFSGVTGSTS